MGEVVFPYWSAGYYRAPGLLYLMDNTERYLLTDHFAALYINFSPFKKVILVVPVPALVLR